MDGRIRQSHHCAFKSHLYRSQQLGMGSTGLLRLLKAWNFDAFPGSPTRLVMRMVHSRRPLSPVSPSREFALTRATLSRFQADPVLLRIQLESGSSALVMKLACLVRNDTMRGEVANQSDLRFGVPLCSHLHFSLFQQD